MAPSLRDIRRASTKRRRTREEGAPVPKRIATETAPGTEANMASEGNEARGRDPHLPSVPSPIDLTTASPAREAAASPAPEAAPEAGPGSAASERDPDAAPSKGKGKAEAAQAGALAEASETRSEAEPAPGPSAEAVDVSFQSILSRYTRWAEQSMLDASTPEVQGYLRQQKSTVFFREAAVAQLWTLNSWTAIRDLWIQSQAALDQSLEEIQEVKARAEAALEEARVEATRVETARTRKAEADAATFRARAEEAENALEVARRQAANELDKARGAEEKLTAAESEIFLLKNRLHSATIEISAAEERAENAEEIARRSDDEVAALKAALSKAEERATEAEKKTLEAVEDFRKSAAFNDELAETSSFAYDGGFKDCKEKIKRLFQIEGIDDVEPDDEGNDVADPAEP